MLDQANRTFICSVVFIDLVGYSKKPVAEQIRLKTSLTNNLSEAIKDIPVNDRIILDTGDGAAISFLGDPEDALFTCLSLRESMLKDRQDAPSCRGRRGGLGAHRHQPRAGEAGEGHQRAPQHHRRRHQRRAAHHELRAARPDRRVALVLRRGLEPRDGVRQALHATRVRAPTSTCASTRSTWSGHSEGALKKAQDSMKDRAVSTSTNVKRDRLRRRAGLLHGHPDDPRLRAGQEEAHHDRRGTRRRGRGLGILVATKKGDAPATAPAWPPFPHRTGEAAGGAQGRAGVRRRGRQEGARPCRRRHAGGRQDRRRQARCREGRAHTAPRPTQPRRTQPRPSPRSPPRPRYRPPPWSSRSSPGVKSS